MGHHGQGRDFVRDFTGRGKVNGGRHFVRSKGGHAVAVIIAIELMKVTIAGIDETVGNGSNEELGWTAGTKGRNVGL